MSMRYVPRGGTCGMFPVGIFLNPPDTGAWVIIVLHRRRVVIRHWTYIEVIGIRCRRNGLPCAVGVMAVGASMRSVGSVNGRA